MGEAIQLLGAAVELAPDVTVDDLFANDLAARACMTMACRQLQAAATLLFNAFYSEARVLLRTVYESAGLARMLARDPEMAEKWFRKPEWFPDREVRRWLRETRGDDETAVEAFRVGYRHMSAWAHPTAGAAMTVVSFENGVPRMQLVPEFDEHKFALGCQWTAAIGVFACFAIRNAAVDESALDPAWRRDLYRLAGELSGEAMPHLERDWEQENRKYQEMQDRVQQVERLHAHLAEHPLSWDNLTGRGPSQGRKDGSET
jgi:hypothetical protein